MKGWRGTSTGRSCKTFSSAGSATQSAGPLYMNNDALMETLTMYGSSHGVYLAPPRKTMNGVGKKKRDWAECLLPTEFGDFKMRSYPTGEIVMHIGADEDGTFSNDCEKPVKIRIHSECVTSEIFGSVRCDCAIQLNDALRIMAEHGKGVLVYLKQEGRGLG